MPYTEEEVLELARRAYRSGDASFEIERGRCALLVIDMQNEFVRPKWTPYWVPEATRRIPTIRHLIEKCRAMAVPVILPHLPLPITTWTGHQAAPTCQIAFRASCTIPSGSATG